MNKTHSYVLTEIQNKENDNIKSNKNFYRERKQKEVVAAIRKKKSDKHNRHADKERTDDQKDDKVNVIISYKKEKEALLPKDKEKKKRVKKKKKKRQYKMNNIKAIIEKDIIIIIQKILMDAILKRRENQNTYRMDRNVIKKLPLDAENIAAEALASKSKDQIIFNVSSTIATLFVKKYFTNAQEIYMVENIGGILYKESKDIIKRCVVSIFMAIAVMREQGKVDLAYAVSSSIIYALNIGSLKDMKVDIESIILNSGGSQIMAANVLKTLCDVYESTEFNNIFQSKKGMFPMVAHTKNKRELSPRR